MEKGCVYFFRHIGLTPVKIGYSENESPINRFNQFKTYAPYGSEIVGFIQTDNPRMLEKTLHQKFYSKKINGEWFEINDSEINYEIDFYSKIEDVQDRNNFQIAWANELNDKKHNIKNEVVNSSSNTKKDYFLKIFKDNNKINKTKIADKLGVTRQTIHTWVNETK